MSDDLYRALLDRLDEDAARWHRGDRLRRDVDQARAALRAVVELHTPVQEGPAPFHYFTCSGCDNGSYAVDSPDWPCSTIQAIAEALGITP